MPLTIITIMQCVSANAITHQLLGASAKLASPSSRRRRFSSTGGKCTGGSSTLEVVILRFAAFFLKKNITATQLISSNLVQTYKEKFAIKHSEGIRLLESTDGDGDLLAQEDEIEQKKYPADLLAIPLRSALLQTG